jgi:hypothetical protein
MGFTLLFDLVSPASEVLDHTLHAIIRGNVVGRSEYGIAFIERHGRGVAFDVAIVGTSRKSHVQLLRDPGGALQSSYNAVR